MRVEQPNADALAGFEPGDRVSITWEGHDGRLHVKNGTIIGRTARAIDVRGPGDRHALCLGASAVRTISKASGSEAKAGA